MVNGIELARKCDVEGCGAVASGAVAILFFPYQALMRYHGKTEPLTRMVTTLVCCQEHKPKSAADMFPAEHLAAFAKSVESVGGISVDLSGCQVVLVPFTDPDYVRLLEAKQEKQEEQHDG